MRRNFQQQYKFISHESDSEKLYRFSEEWNVKS